ncbi:MAG: TetR/AcrR family transcriptional regulator [Vicinamibacterales bacterium]
MTQEERSEKSRAAILEAALALFSHVGYRATSIRDIAGRAGVSTGSVYHHFRDKEAIFDTLLQQFWAFSAEPSFPLNRALEAGAFPNRLEELAGAAREVIAGWRPHVALMYVDVVEFDGRHIHKFYADLARRCEAFAASHPAELAAAGPFHPDLPLAPAMVMTIRVFIYYFVVELLFGVPNHYGMSSDEAIQMMSGILKRGMLQQPGAARPAAE